MAYAVPDPFNEAIRNGLAITYSVDAYLGATPVAGAQDMAPVGGSITDTSKPGVRRVLSLDLAPEPGLFDALSPIGTTLKAYAHVMYTDRTSATIPMGVFDVDSETLAEGGGKLSLTAPDKWVRIQRADFAVLGISFPGMLVVDQIATMIRDALGADEPVNITATSTAVMGVQTWDRDRGKAINELAAGIGAWVFFDRDGFATIADLPTASASADWLIDASASGVLVELSRTRSRSSTYNFVSVSSSASDEESFPTQLVWDDDPTSPTYAGTNPPFAVDTAPFGIVPYFYATPLPLNSQSARQAGLTILARTTGLASQVSLGSVPNPAIDALDALDVLPPQQRYDIPRVLERHIADTVTHPLSYGSAQSIEARSTRTDEFT